MTLDDLKLAFRKGGNSYERWTGVVWYSLQYKFIQLFLESGVRRWYYFILMLKCARMSFLPFQIPAISSQASNLTPACLTVYGGCQWFSLFFFPTFIARISENDDGDEIDAVIDEAIANMILTTLVLLLVSPRHYWWLIQSEISDC